MNFISLATYLSLYLSHFCCFKVYWKEFDFHTTFFDKLSSATRKANGICVWCGKILGCKWCKWEILRIFNTSLDLNFDMFCSAFPSSNPKWSPFCYVAVYDCLSRRRSPLGRKIEVSCCSLLPHCRASVVAAPPSQIQVENGLFVTRIS